MSNPKTWILCLPPPPAAGGNRHRAPMMPPAAAAPCRQPHPLSQCSQCTQTITSQSPAHTEPALALLRHSSLISVSDFYFGAFFWGFHICPGNSTLSFVKAKNLTFSTKTSWGSQVTTPFPVQPGIWPDQTCALRVRSWELVDWSVPCSSWSSRTSRKAYVWSLGNVN